jgi:hypothetical protein
MLTLDQIARTLGGAGHFGPTGDPDYRRPAYTLTSTNRALVESLHVSAELGSIFGPYRFKHFGEHARVQWRWQVGGHDLVELLDRLGPRLSDDARQRAEALIEAYPPRPGRFRRRR